MNIPIYRAKKIDSDEYVEGYFYQPTHFISDGGKIIDEKSYDNVKIDLSTLAIHFDDMLDNQGNKIFASLSENGKGGDIFIWDNEKFIVWFDGQTLTINATNKDNFESYCHDSLNEWYDFNSNCYDLKVIEIKE